MKTNLANKKKAILKGGYLGAVAVALLTTSGAQAQSESDDENSNANTAETIIVTGSRISKTGFDQPTPTTVIGTEELLQGDRPNIQQVLNDQPQFRPTVTPTVSVGNTSSGTAPADLRGLGTNRTLTLVNGRRYVGDNNLNFVPTSLISRVEVVTGGASAAWGSGAVAGVVNIILNDELEGLTLGADYGISSRGDGARYGFEGSYGTSFADGAGHVMIGAEYVKDKGVLDRNSRKNLGSANFIPVAGGLELVRDVNTLPFGISGGGGLITSGIFAGQTFNRDGSLRAFSGPNAQGVGGSDAVGLYDHIIVSTPVERMSIYARASYDIGNAKLWIDGTYGRSESDYDFLPDFLTPPLTIQADNPYLSAGIQSQLAAAGETSFSYYRLFDDLLMSRFNGIRENKEGAIGIDGFFGNGFKYSAHYSHGEVDSDQSFGNARLASNFDNAVNAVLSGGDIVCAINADGDPTNDDPACSPLNPFGRYNASAESLNYVTGTQRSFSTSKLDSLGAEVQGDLFSLWAGPVTVAVGVEARWEELVTTRTPETVAGDFGIPLFTTDLSGGFNVKEGFAEIAMPLLDIEDKFTLDFNGAARYSDYSTSGGIWSWKAGGTARLFNDILLRVTRSRDIRSPSINELFSSRSINVRPLVDQDTEGRAAANPAYNPNPALVTTFTGGNPDLNPEISSTLTFGGSISPSFLPGFRFSVDYYDISIDGAIATLSGSNLTLACKQGSVDACARITRDGTGTVTQVLANFQNIAQFETSGIDFEAAYTRPVMDGSLRIRAIASYVDKFIFDTGLNRNDTAGDVGSGTLNGVPKWRGTLSVGYDNDDMGADVRVRYIDGGLYDHLLTNLVNNKTDARTYVDLGLRFKVTDRFTLSGNVNNLFDKNPPLSPQGNPHYDVIGTYFSIGAKAKF
ncbi:TonB-dependent receptor plug domain-containing protein [Parasphingorhabdus sp.]|uniref:TonB-dependent receptor plug domain-containing protein n=1 Tax=Parasphingorhabdus sp. TaxID=2709688 RepID=UPI002F91E94C